MNGMDIHRVQFRQDVHQFLFICDFIVYMYSICTINDLFMNHVSFVSRKKDFYMNHVSFVNVDIYDMAFIC